MENRKELLEQYMEDGKLPLKGELFARKSLRAYYPCHFKKKWL